MYNIIMKKIVFVLILFLGFCPSVLAKDRKLVKFSSCVDGDTAKFILNGEEITVRFLAIDTPETKHPTKGEEPYGKEASKFTCSKIKNGKKIEIEYDRGSEKTDKYNRHLAWIWVDGFLLQDDLIKEGLAEVAYLYGDYSYTDILKEHQTLARLNKVGKWSDKDDINCWYILFIIVLIIIGCYISPKFYKKVKRKIKSESKKRLKKYGL